MDRKWLVLGSLAMAVPIAVLIFPYATSAYHLEAGGRALEEVLGEIDPLNWWYVGPIEAQDSPALEGAIAHLEKATEYSHALRLLARAYAAHGDLLSSIEALRQYTARRPENAMGHLELAAAYERVDRALQGLYSANLLEMLPGAMVSAPDLPGETRYQPEGWESEYAYPTAFLLPPDEEARPTLFLHAGSRVTYTLTLTQPAMLRFAMGLDPRSFDWGGDGVTFEVAVDGARVFLEHLPVEAARKGWQERQVDLSAFAGRTIALSLASTSGPAGDLTADWAGWREPRLEAPEAGVYRQTVGGDPWRNEWVMAGVTAEEFVGAGEGAWEGRRYEDALAWYEYGEMFAQLQPESVLHRGFGEVSADQDSEFKGGTLSALATHVLTDSLQIEAETLQWIRDGKPLSDYPASDPSVGVMWFGSDAISLVRVLHSANYHLILRAQDTPPSPIQLQLTQDLDPIATFALDHEDMSWQELQAETVLEAGLHVIGVRFLNDGYSSGIDRNAVLDWIRLQVE